MGRIERKLNRRAEKNSIIQKPITKDGYDYIYNMVRAKLHKDLTEEVAGYVESKVVPKLKEELRKDIVVEVTNEAYAYFLAVACNILLNDFGKLNRKDTRLKVFYEKMQGYLEKIEDPDEKQIEAERELSRQVGGIEIKR